MISEDFENVEQLKQKVHDRLVELGDDLLSAIKEDDELNDSESVHYFSDLLKHYNRREKDFSFWELVALDRSIEMWLSLRVYFMQTEVQRYKAKRNASRPRKSVSRRNLERDLRIVKRSHGWKQIGREEHELTGLVLEHIPDSPSAPTIRKILRRNGVIRSKK